MAQTTVPLNVPAEQPTRRAMLGTLAAGVLGSATAFGSTEIDQRPDTELLQAGRRWHEAGRIWLQDPDNGVSEAAHGEFERMDARITALPASTAAGVAVRLRVALLHTNLMGAAEEAVLCGGRCSDDMFDTDSQRMLWQAIATLEQLDGGRA